MKRRFLALTIGFMLLSFLTGCGKNQKIPAMKDDRDAMLITTSCGDLVYPADWENEIKVKEENTDFGISVVFETSDGSQEIELFTLNVGGGEGEEIGTLTDKDGKERVVKMVIDELQMEGVDEEIANRLFAMQEDINYILEHLH